MPMETVGLIVLLAVIVVILIWLGAGKGWLSADKNDTETKKKDSQ